jgi:hypothetical protein
MHLEPSTGTGLLLGVCTVLVVVFLFVAHLSNLKQKVPLFYCWLGAIAVLGGAAAFFLPIAVNSGFAKDDDGSALRQALLYTTGGLLGVITLGETHRKNNQEKEKNENDHTRQVYAERRSRYAKAVEQLGDEKATIRLGGIYTLVGLVDEWLTDDTLNPKERQKEGQVIINNLCSYIRSPFPLAAKIEEYEAHKELEKLQKTEPEKLSEGESSRLQILLKRFKDSGEYEKPTDITADYAKFHEEQDVRRTIFVEMSKRSSVISGAWSDFDFDFSRAPIFYPLNRLTIEKGNFSSAKFYSNAVFSWTKFIKTADFRGAKFTKNANFSGVTFTKNTSFRGATFTKYANFSRVRFTQDANFSRATFTQNANFSEATFTQNANFSEATFSASSPKFVETSEVKKVKFVKISEVKFVETSEVSERTIRARFATLPKNQRAYSFTVREGSFPILLGEAELDGVKHHIPVGTVLFDPSSGETSEPAKPLENSDTKEEKPTE